MGYVTPVVACQVGYGGGKWVMSHLWSLVRWDLVGCNRVMSHLWLLVRWDLVGCNRVMSHLWLLVRWDLVGCNRVMSHLWLLVRWDLVGCNRVMSHLWSLVRLDVVRCNLVMSYLWLLLRWGIIILCYTCSMSYVCCCWMEQFFAVSPNKLAVGIELHLLLLLLLLSRYAGELGRIWVEETRMDGRTVGHCEVFDWICLWVGRGGGLGG